MIQHCPVPIHGLVRPLVKYDKHGAKMNKSSMQFSVEGQVGLQSQASRAGGFVLLEALVAMLVFALGILGLVGMQASMTREQTTAKVRSDAAYLTEEVIGMMWGDIAHLSSYATANCASYTRCNDWANKVLATLPSAQYSVVVTTLTGDVTVTLSWTMPNGDQHKYTSMTTIVAAGAS